MQEKGFYTIGELGGWLVGGGDWRGRKEKGKGKEICIYIFFLLYFLIEG
jgi:hypothetical protein